MTTVTTVIVSYNSAAVLPACLESLPEAFGSLSYEVVVADNDSHDDSVRLAGLAAPAANVVQVGRNAGYAAAINAAIEARRGAGPILVLNPDVRLQPGSVEALMAALDESRAGIAVPPSSPLARRSRSIDMASASRMRRSLKGGFFVLNS